MITNVIISAILIYCNTDSTYIREGKNSRETLHTIKVKNPIDNSVN